ncbi:MAG: right-handed parallel beta-helix repeat-containing protein [Phycisphaerales bacterium]|nr:right-handed parallel beta-helix repeat-containing protein [Phycisphaerales bacterium]
MILTTRKSNAFGFSVLAFMASLGTTSLVSADVLTVGPTGTSQFQQIQSAIDAAQHGDTIVVAPGSYSVPVAGTVADLQGKRITLQSSHGPGWTTIAYRADSTTTGRGIRCSSFETEETVIEGFRFMLLGDKPDLLALVDGPGLLIEQASPTILNCSFESSCGGFGGAVTLRGSNSRFEHCTFSNNWGEDGGAIALHETSDATFISCSFDMNEAKWDGGAVLVGGSSIGRFDDCRFNQNKALKSGGGIFAGGTFMQIANCEFNENNAGNGGGAIGAWVTSVFAESTTFSRNSVEEPTIYNDVTGGGAISYSLCTMELLNCHFDENLTKGFNPGDGSDGGAIRQSYESFLYCTACSFTSNVTGGSGGAIYSTDSLVLITESSILNNASFGGSGGGLFMDGGIADVTDTEFVGGWAAWGYGAGAFNRFGSVVLYERCQFSQGLALIGGGAVAQIDSEARYLQCTFENAVSDESGGAMYNEDSNVLVDDCLFSGSEAAYAGHAMYNSGGRVELMRTIIRDHVYAGAFHGYAIHNTNGALADSIDGSFCNNLPDHVLGTPLTGMGNIFESDCPSNFPRPNGISHLQTYDPYVRAEVESNGSVLEHVSGGYGVEARARLNNSPFPPFAHAESVGVITGYERRSSGMSYSLSTEADLHALATTVNPTMECSGSVYADTIVTIETDRNEMLELNIKGLGAAGMHETWHQRSVMVEVYDANTFSVVDPIVIGDINEAWRYSLPAGGRYHVSTQIEVSGSARHVLPGGSSGVERAFEENWRVNIDFTILGDIGNDGVVDGADLSAMLGSWGSDAQESDLNGDGIVDGGDMAILLGNWG